eukprot:2946546-Ditylum_brightwellii.AAC.1
MEDSDALIAMNFMSDLVAITLFSNQDIAICCMAQMIQLSLNYGVCKESSFAIACGSRMLYAIGLDELVKDIQIFEQKVIEHKQEWIYDTLQQNSYFLGEGKKLLDENI